jgi:hypothetical protein
MEDDVSLSFMKNSLLSILKNTGEARNVKLGIKIHKHIFKSNHCKTDSHRLLIYIFKSLREYFLKQNIVPFRLLKNIFALPSEVKLEFIDHLEAEIEKIEISNVKHIRLYFNVPDKVVVYHRVPIRFTAHIYGIGMLSNLFLRISCKGERRSMYLSVEKEMKITLFEEGIKGLVLCIVKKTGAGDVVLSGYKGIEVEKKGVI